ncbi:hypothetical protein ACLESD_27705 [Pyxidicoccus sp. 3LFB2]
MRSAPLLLLLLAVPSLAQPSRGPDLGPVGPPLITFSEPTSLDGETPAPTAVRRSGPVRVAAEAGGSLVGAIGLGVTGFFAGGLLSLATCKDVDVSLSGHIVASCGSGAFIGGLAGAGLGIPLGVWWGGGKAGGNGRFLGALGGLGVSVASAGTAHLLRAEDLGFALLATAPVLSIVGYELTDSAPKTPTSTRVAPSVSVSSGGASFGLQGRF